MGITVLGHFPLYARVSDKLGARHLDVSPRNWTPWSRAQRLSENTYFLHRTLARADRIVLTHPPTRARPGSSYEFELRFLQAQGVTAAGFHDVQVVR